MYFHMLSDVQEVNIGWYHSALSSYTILNPPMARRGLMEEEGCQKTGFQLAVLWVPICLRCHWITDLSGCLSAFQFTHLWKIWNNTRFAFLQGVWLLTVIKKVEVRVLKQSIAQKAPRDGNGSWDFVNTLACYSWVKCPRVMRRGQARTGAADSAVQPAACPRLLGALGQLRKHPIVQNMHL